MSRGQVGLSSGGAAQVGRAPSVSRVVFKNEPVNREKCYEQTLERSAPMLGPQFESEQGDRALTQIYEGMVVHDRKGRRIGTVEYVYLGEVAEARDMYGYHKHTSSILTSSDGALIEEFANAVILTERLPEI